MTEPSFWPPRPPLSRSISARMSRFFRARLREFGKTCELIADEPRTVLAWRHGWDAGHYGKLLALRDSGIRPNVIYDIGAHYGHWAEMADAIFSPSTVILFEPQTALAQQANLRALEHPGWRVVETALGNSERQTEMHVTSLTAASSLLKPSDSTPQAEGIFGRQHKEVVREQALDFLRQRDNIPSPNLVKIDVQGYEANVIDGGTETLSNAEVIIVETSIHPQYEEQSLLPEVLHRLVELGFELYDFTESFRWWPGPVWQVDLWLTRPPAPTSTRNT